MYYAECISKIVTAGYVPYKTGCNARNAYLFHDPITWYCFGLKLQLDFTYNCYRNGPPRRMYVWERSFRGRGRACSQGKPTQWDTVRHRLTMQALCHCRDCRKITGSTYSTNGIWPVDQFKLTQGTPKKHVKTADSGNTITSFFWCVSHAVWSIRLMLKSC